MQKEPWGIYEHEVDEVVERRARSSLGQVILNALLFIESKLIAHP